MMIPEGKLHHLGEGFLGYCLLTADYKYKRAVGLSLSSSGGHRGKVCKGRENEGLALWSGPKVGMTTEMRTHRGAG